MGATLPGPSDIFGRAEPHHRRRRLTVPTDAVAAASHRDGKLIPKKWNVVISHATADDDALHGKPARSTTTHTIDGIAAEIATLARAAVEKPAAGADREPLSP